MRANRDFLSRVLANFFVAERESRGTRRDVWVERGRVEPDFEEAVRDEEDAGLGLEDFSDHPAKGNAGEGMPGFVAD